MFHLNLSKMKLIVLAFCVSAGFSMPIIDEIAHSHFQQQFGVRFNGDASKFTTVQEGDFSEWIKTHGKKYETTTEKSARFVIFQANNWLAQAMQRSATYGVKGPFADLTVGEFKKLYRNMNMSMARVPFEKAVIPTGTKSAEVDWRSKGVVTPVKNQGQCGSCWAFSTTGNIEGQWAINKGQLISLSEQELVDCDTTDDGCNGGLPSNAYNAIIQLGGLETENDYPYTARDGTCQFDKSRVSHSITGSLSISSNEEEMASWCAANGPISIGINANNMQLYQGGVAEPSRFSCDPSQLDHGVLITGYGVSNGVNFWWIKNSWGPSWGEEGYYRVVRGTGACGLNQMCTSSKV